MRKYFTVFAIDWQSQFIYRLNFILWRFRNVLRLLMTYFLWRGIFVSNQFVYGYSQPQMLTYVFLVLIVQTLVISAPSSDNIGGEIANGDLSNYLVKPVSYLKYWFTRDLSSKVMNILFATVEITLLWLWLKPTIQLPGSLLTIIGFTISALLAAVIYFFISASTRFVAFWAPENTWPIAFLTLVLLEILAGGIFPLDILPKWAGILLQFTPFPYLIYFPIAIFLGKINGLELLQIIFQSIVWLVIMTKLTQLIWKKGLANYASEGR